MPSESSQTSSQVSIILPNNIQPPKKSSGAGRPKSIVWETYIKQGKKVSEGHYEATCLFCNTFWHKGSPQILEAHLANNCLKVPLETKQLFLNRLITKAEGSVNKKPNKKQKLNGEAEQSKITDFHESSKLSPERNHEIDRACVKAFIICGIPWHAIENPFFVELLKHYAQDIHHHLRKDFLTSFLIKK
jgi:hypothetical protein